MIKMVKYVRLWVKFVVTVTLLQIWFEKIQALIDSSNTNPRYIKWYTRYDSYPEYCSTPEQMSRRQIPQIRTENFPPGTIGETQLVHVTAVLRHGARTPNSDAFDCWDESFYETYEKRWDCTLTEIVTAQPPSRIKQGNVINSYNSSDFATSSSILENVSGHDDDTGMFLFEKKYDSLKGPLGNKLNGTCKQGQLLSQGYEQEYTNGKILRDAYLSTKNMDNRLQLLDSSLNGIDGKYLWDTIRYRSDDDQRTLMSGQIVLRGLFGPELRSYVNHHNGEYPVIPLHTADMCADIIEPNTDLCPRLDEIIQDTYYNDKEYARLFVSSKEAHLLSDFQRLVLKNPDPESVDSIDCLMTTICTDRKLPEPVNDYTNDNNYQRYNNKDTVDQTKDGSKVKINVFDEIYGPNRFQRLVNFETSWYGYYVTKNEGEFAKLATGPLWSEILDTILPFVSDTPQYDSQDSKRHLSIIAGHDTTLVPMLVSLGPKVWDTTTPPYASMMLIEIHSIKSNGISNRTIFPSNYAFRVLYNGVVLTDRIDGCIFELCDVSVLLNIVQSSITMYTTNCTQQSQTSASFDEKIEQSEELIRFVSLCFVCALIGSTSTFVYMKYGTSQSSTLTYQQYHQALVIESSGYGTEDQVRINSAYSDGKCCLELIQNQNVNLT